MRDTLALLETWENKHRQPHYGSGLEGKQTRGFSEHRESCSSVQRKLTDQPFTVINTQVSSGVFRIGACVGTPKHLQSWLSDPWGLHLGGQSLLQYGPLQTGRGTWGSLDAWQQSCLRCPSFSTVITSSSLFTWVPLGIFPQAVSEQV